MQTNQPAGQSYLQCQLLCQVSVVRDICIPAILNGNTDGSNNGDVINIPVFTTKLDDSHDGFGNGSNQFFSNYFAQCQHCAILYGIDYMNVNYKYGNNYNLNIC